MEQEFKTTNVTVYFNNTNGADITSAKVDSIKWKFSIAANSGSLEWMSVTAPDQAVNVSYDLSVEDPNDSEDFTYEPKNEIFNLADIEIELPRQFTFTSSLNPSSLNIDWQTKKATLDFT